MKKRIFICGFSQESNSFNPTKTTLDNFRNFGIFTGGEVGEKPVPVPSSNGMIDFFTEKNFEIKCGVIMRSGSGGIVEHSTVDYFLENTLEHLKNAMPVDALCVSLHGATVSDRMEDVCGFILETLRGVVGEEIPISAAFDFHGNITDKIMKNADYVSGFQEYPHIDERETGRRAAARLWEKLSGKGGKTVKASIPMIAPANGYTTTKGSLKKLVLRAKDLIKSGEIVDWSIFEVQPWLDVSLLETTIVVIAENEEKAIAVANDIALENFSIRRELLGEKLDSIQDVIDKALENKSGKPVVLVDSSDSPNAGSAGDSAKVIECLLPYRNVLKSAVAVNDAAAVDKAFLLGVGAVSDFSLGATLAPELSTPVLVKDAKVLGLYDGTFYMWGPEDKGAFRSVGKTAILQADKMLIHVSYAGKAEGDINFYRSFGIEPFECDIVAVKACASFRAAYEPLSAEICYADTPGASAANLEKMPFKKRPCPLYPFEEISEKDISKAKSYR